MKTYSMQELAFLGDCVHTMFVREHFLKEKSLKINDLHKICSKYCSARWQSTLYDKLESTLPALEKDVLRQARNSKAKHKAKNADPEQYHKATAFEALVGYLYLNENKEVLSFVLEQSLKEENHAN